MTRGLIIGKFYPPHLGHKYLIDTATNNVDQLTVILCGDAKEIIPPELRADWLTTIHPNIQIQVVYPANEAFRKDDPEAWTTATVNWLGFVPDVVYSSEHYADAYTKYLGIRHVCLDKQRVQFPISATQVRNDPVLYGAYLDPVVKDYFAHQSQTMD